MSAIFHYFQKTNVFLRYFERSTLKRNLIYSCFFFPSFHEHSLSLSLPAFLKLRVLKNNCMCNGDNAHNVDVFPDEKITKRSEPTNQAKTKTNIAKGLKTYLNGSKNYLTTYQGFKICLVILKILCKYWYILNKWRIVSKHTFLLQIQK